MNCRLAKIPIFKCLKSSSYSYLSLFFDIQMHFISDYASLSTGSWKEYGAEFFVYKKCLGCFDQYRVVRALSTLRSKLKRDMSFLKNRFRTTIRDGPSPFKSPNTKYRCHL